MTAIMITAITCSPESETLVRNTTPIMAEEAIDPPILYIKKS